MLMIASSDLNDSSNNLSLPVAKNIFVAAAIISLRASSFFRGHPYFVDKTKFADGFINLVIKLLHLLPASQVGQHPRMVGQHPENLHSVLI